MPKKFIRYIKAEQMFRFFLSLFETSSFVTFFCCLWQLYFPAAVNQQYNLISIPDLISLSIPVNGIEVRLLQHGMG
jgi:hypothetical protein